MINYLKQINIDNLKDNEYIIINNKKYTIKKIEPNIYCFDNNESYESHSFIKIKNQLFELDDLDLFITFQNPYDGESEILSHSQYINEFKKIKDNNEYLNYYIDSDFLNDNPTDCFIDYYCTLKIDDEHYLGVAIKYVNSLQTCIFNKQIFFYILNKDLSKKYSLLLKNNDVKILSQLFDEPNNFNYHIQLASLDLNDLINDTSKIDLFNVFDSTPYKSLIMKNINTLTNPILQEGDIKAYFQNFPNIFDKDIYIINNDKSNTNFEKKAEAIAKYLTGDSCINVFTGEIIEQQFTLLYKDLEYIIIYVENTNFRYIYEQIDNIYCLIKIVDDLSLKKIDQAMERANMIKLLSS